MVHGDRDACHAGPTFPSVDCRFLQDPFLEETGAESLSQTLEIYKRKYFYSHDLEVTRKTIAPRNKTHFTPSKFYAKDCAKDKRKPMEIQLNIITAVYVNHLKISKEKSTKNETETILLITSVQRSRP